MAQHYGFVKFAFSDGLYWEAQRAYGLEDQALLRDRALKEEPQECLALKHCKDKEFIKVAQRQISDLYPDTFFVLENVELSPRQVLQWWGTDYRRAQDENYWVKTAASFVEQMHFRAPYPELRPALFVEAGTRFENERGWIKSIGGNIWHIHRGDDTVKHAHVSAMPLTVLENEREIWNDGTMGQLHEAVDMLFNTDAKFVKIEPLNAAADEPGEMPAERGAQDVARVIDGPTEER